MEDNLFDIFEDLNISEMSLLLDQDFDLHMDKKVQKRIIDSVRKKSQLDFSNNENIPDKFKNILKSLFINKRLATLCTIFILFLGYGGYLYAQVSVAYVAIDINPSIELSLNKFNKVVSYEAYNLDGKTLLASNYDTHICVDKAIDTIITDAINKNYISSSEDSSITLSTVSDDTILRENLEIHLKDTIEKSLENQSINTSIKSSNNNLTKRDEAKNIGFTVGKLLLVEELKSLDSSIIIEDFKDISISEIENKILEFENNSSNHDNGTLHSIDKSTINSNNENSTRNSNSNSNNGNSNSNSNSNSNNENSNSNSNSNSNNENSNSNSNSNSNNENTSNNNTANSKPDKDKDKNHESNINKNGND